ncbi:hypothetical protein L226DRAFT_489918 [Lentinus tigrinus ALCF2SS1-7]|uniref:BTB domain-containing protein n=1 Tax=Lentinus tigrinus ALCF2SS1-6 TaxID=1328759 RepID=A0A5C2S4H5_9APHY|nr:hypothetical protein L227DRAFT_528606 [Lentinus tigrinus ALCF2SS1-6]RPD72807.1 hypothetical protein L226DRAFT_489918 [Lentinus tigrinus ALCF2SS1-7]
MPLTPPVSPSPPPDEDVYTVVMRGEEFQLTYDQITFDSPNFFTACFTTGFAESKDHVLKLSRNPVVFSLIVEYLSGYPILPLTAEFLPAGMSLAMARRFLVADADFYGLERLSTMLTLPSPSIDLSWMGLGNEFVSLHDVLGDKLPDDVILQDDGSLVSAGSRLPVLVYAKDGLLRITITPEGQVEFELLSTSESSSPILDPSTSALLRMEDVERNGSLCVDGSNFMLKELSSPQSILSVSSLLALLRRVGNGTTHHDRNGVREKFTFWADSVICTFPSRSQCDTQHGSKVGATASGGARLGDARLLKARVRSMNALIRELDVVGEDGSPQESSNLLADLGSLVSNATLQTAPSSSQSAPSSTRFAPSSTRFAPSSTRFAPSSIRFAPSSIRFAPSSARFASSSTRFVSTILLQEESRGGLLQARGGFTRGGGISYLARRGLARPRAIISSPVRGELARPRGIISSSARGGLRGRVMGRGLSY